MYSALPPLYQITTTLNYTEHYYHNYLQLVVLSSHTIYCFDPLVTAAGYATVAVIVGVALLTLLAIHH